MVGGFSWMHWMVVLVIVVLVFGTKKLGNVGADLGKAVKGFKDGIKGSDEEKDKAAPASQVAEKSTIDVEAKEKTKS